MTQKSSLSTNNNPIISSSSNSQPQKPFRVLNLTFASKRVLTDFLLYSSLIIFIPIILVIFSYNYVKDNPLYSQVDKMIFSVGPAVLLINVVIGVYIYKVIKDPHNYQKDQPIKVEIKQGLKEENMNKRWEEKKRIKQMNKQQQEKGKGKKSKEQ